MNVEPKCECGKPRDKYNSHCDDCLEKMGAGLSDQTTEDPPHVKKASEDLIAMGQKIEAERKNNRYNELDDLLTPEPPVATTPEPINQYFKTGDKVKLTVVAAARMGYDKNAIYGITYLDEYDNATLTNGMQFVTDVLIKVEDSARDWEGDYYRIEAAHEALIEENKQLKKDAELFKLAKKQLNEANIYNEELEERIDRLEYKIKQAEEEIDRRTKQVEVTKAFVREMI